MKVIVTGATGMVGEGVLLECLADERVDEVLALGRRASEKTHRKLREIVRSDLHDLSGAEEQLAGCDACFFCLGATSVGMSEAAYTRLTYDLTVYVAETLLRINPGIVFCYVTGMGTDASERGRSMWARVKGRTENRLLAMPFGAAYMFRPGYMHPVKGQSNAHRYYSYIGWMYPLLRRVWPGGVCSLRELGQAMIQSVAAKPPSGVLEVRDIVRLAAGN